jgi:hypothetical protein
MIREDVSYDRRLMQSRRRWRTREMRREMVATKEMARVSTISPF